MKLSHYRLSFILILLCNLFVIQAQTFLKNTSETQSITGTHILIVAALPDDPALIAMEEALNARGKSYKALIATHETLTDDLLFDPSGKGQFNAVILTEGNLSYHDGSNWRSAFDTQEWEKLWVYEKTYDVKQVSLYTYPGGSADEYGLSLVQPIDTTLRPYAVMTTEKGKEIFNPLLEQFNISGTYGYLSQLKPVLGVNSTPLIVDDKGNILAVYSTFEGRERIALTMSQNRDAEHSQKLFAGLISWLTPSLAISTTLETVKGQTLTLEYLLFLTGFMIIALLLANWLIQRYKNKRRLSNKNSFYNF